jgi:hypothetical protein
LQAGRTPLERTSVQWAAVCVLWCGVAGAATQPVLRNLDSNVGSLGMRVRQECCGFEGLQAGRTPPSAPLYGRHSRVCDALVWVLQLQPPAVLRNLDSNVGLFRNACQAGCCEFRRIVGGKDATERTSVRRWAPGVCVLWCGCCSCSTHVSKKRTAMLDYLGMRVRQEL